MFGPRDHIPDERTAATCRLVYDSGRFYLVLSFGGGCDDWMRVEITRRQVAGLIEDGLPRVLVK